MSSDAAQQLSAPQYARLSRRLHAMVIDWIVTLLVIFGAVFVASTVRDDNLSRPLGIIVVIALLLYEPVLVSLTGSTVGHYLANLRVIDDRHHGNISFFKSVARFVIKTVLGLYSFIVIAATRRNQAIHDKLTRSTVQIRDPAKALPSHYISERIEFMNLNLPSRTRRAVVIFFYLLLTFVAFVLTFAGLMFTGAISAACGVAGRCSTTENILTIAAALIWIAASGWFIGLGWRGKLFGARMHAKS